MQPYTIVVLVHIAAAVALLSSSVVGAPVIRAAVRRAATGAEVSTLLRAGRPLHLIQPLAAVGVLASGIYLANVANVWSFGWVRVAVAFWIVNAVVAGGLVNPLIARVGSAAGELGSAPVDARLDALRWSPRWSAGGDVLAGTDAAMLVLMTLRPGLVGSLLVVTAVTALVGAVGLASHVAHARRPATPAPAAAEAAVEGEPVGR
jgi:hypothetical protein